VLRRARAVAALVVVAGCHRHEDKPPPPPPPDVVPHVTGPIAIDGEWDESDWANRALRYVLTDPTGAPARPASELRLLRDDRDLYVALYAADENIETGDHFDLTLGYLTLHLAATGAVQPTVPGLRVKVGLDEGTLDMARDDDEEWVVELAVPLATFAGARELPVKAARCDTPKGGIPRCGAFASGLGNARPLLLVYPTTQ